MPDSTASPLTPSSPISLGDKIDAYWELKNAMAVMNSQVKELKTQYDELERDLIHALDDIGTVGGQGHKARATITESEVSQTDDYDALCDFIKENPEERMYLFERKIAVTHWRELKQMLGQDIPGLSSYTRRKISINKVN